MLKKEIFDSRAHFASSREGSRAKSNVIFISCFSILSNFLFLAYNDNLLRCIIVGSSRAGNGTHDGRSIMIDYRHTDSGQTDPFDSTSHLTKDIDGKNAQYKAVSNRNGHLFVAFVVDRFGTVIKGVQAIFCANRIKFAQKTWH